MYSDDSAALAAQAQSSSPIEDFSDVPADKRTAVLYARRALANGSAYNEGVLDAIWLQLGNYNRRARRLSPARRSKLLKAATSCARCGEPFNKTRKKTIEHTRGDDNSPDALTVVCWDCNQLTAGAWKPENPQPDRRDELLELVARTLPPNPRVFDTPLPEGKYAFQADAIERVWTQLCAGKKTILQAVTGAGKTRQAIYIAIRALKVRPGRPVLVVVHRSNMFRNWLKQFLAAGFDERDISYGECPTNLLAPVQMATIQSMHRRPDIAAWPSIVIVDECHHAAAKSYHELFDQFGLLENHAGAPFLLGLSATPVRHDRKSLGQYFDIMEKAESADKLRELKVIRRVIYQAPTDKHFEQALREISKKSHGEDFSAKDIDSLLTEERFAILVGDAADHWARFGSLLAIVFVARIKDCEPTVTAFNARGARADFITGEMTPELREAKLSAFERGEINVLVNALLLTEAVDVPEACYVAMLRPTRSYVLWKQMIGRGLRYVEGGPEHVIVCDHCANINRCGIGHPHNEPEYELDKSVREIVLLGGKSGYKKCVECGTLNELCALECEQCGALFAGKGERKYLNIDGYLEEVPEGAITIAAFAEKVGHDEKEVRYWLVNLDMPGRINQNLIDGCIADDWYAGNREKIKRLWERKNAPDDYIPAKHFALRIGVSPQTVVNCIKNGMPSIGTMVHPDIATEWLKKNNPVLLAPEGYISAAAFGRGIGVSGTCIKRCIKDGMPAIGTMVHPDIATRWIDENRPYLLIVDPKERHKALWSSPERRAKYSAMAKITLNNAWKSPEYREKHSAAMKATMAKPEYREKLSSAVKAAAARPEVKAKQSAAQKARWSCQEAKDKHSAIMKDVAARPEEKAKRSAIMKAAATRPEEKAKRSAIMKAVWARPEVKDKRSTAAKIASARPEVRAKRSAAQRARWARRTAKEKWDEQS